MKHKPCPFCGNNNIKIPTGSLYVECTNCGAYGPSVTIDTYSLMQRELQESMVWDKWNERYEVSKV